MTHKPDGDPQKRQPGIMTKAAGHNELARRFEFGPARGHNELGWGFEFGPARRHIVGRQGRELPPLPHFSFHRNAELLAFRPNCLDLQTNGHLNG